MEMKTKKVKGSQWSNLPLDLLFLIGEEHLVLYPDKVRFSCVCVSWRCSIQPKLPFQRPRLPWMLDCFADDEKTGRARLFNLVNTKAVNHVQVPEGADGKIILRGSSHGWVVNVGRTPDIDLFNPLTGARIQLPPRYTFPDVLCHDPKTGFYELQYAKKKTIEFYKNHLYMSRVLLSSNPSHDFVAVAIYGPSRLAYCRPQDHKWTDLTPQGAKLVKTMHINPYPYGGSSYLVQSSSGDLLLVKESYPPKALKFEIFKLDCSTTNKTRSPGWRQVKDLGDDILFLGSNSNSFAISASQYKAKKNRIYFINRFYRRDGKAFYRWVGVFNVDNGSIHQLLSYKINNKYNPPPIWVIQPY